MKFNKRKLFKLAKKKLSNVDFYNADSLAEGLNDFLMDAGLPVLGGKPSEIIGLSHDNGVQFDSILEELVNLGVYDVID